MLGVAMGLLLLAPAAPVPPVPPAPPVTQADRNQAAQFANMVYNAAVNIANMYARKVELGEYMAAAVIGLYDEAGQTAPEDLLKSIREGGIGQQISGLSDARLRLANVPALAGPRAFYAAVNGFKHATDPGCGLTSPRVNNYVSIDVDFWLGFELEGATGTRYSIYRVERGIAQGIFPNSGILGPIPKPDSVPAPAAFPWRVKRVIPGGPAQRAGIRPGDIITKFDGTEVTATTANKLFGDLAFPAGQGLDPRFGVPPAVKRTLTFRREGKDDPFTISMTTETYVPETLQGVVRLPEGKWDCMLDRDYKIGYIRVGSIEEKSDEQMMEMLDDLTRKGCRGLILDLRWCPGGYVTPGTNLTGLFLEPNTLIASLDVRNPGALGRVTSYRAPPAPVGGRFLKTPVLVLVGSETTGGGELIAAALQDNRRCEVMGQRTVGRGSIQNSVDVNFGGLQFRVTTGTTLRPNGKPRQKNPDSQPTDEWGIRPDMGLEVPVTADLATQLKHWAEEHALRPADSDEALPFDDPMKDPFRAAALAHLRKKLGRPPQRK